MGHGTLLVHNYWDYLFWWTYYCQQEWSLFWTSKWFELNLEPINLLVDEYLSLSSHVANALLLSSHRTSWNQSPNIRGQSPQSGESKLFWPSPDQSVYGMLGPGKFTFTWHKRNKWKNELRECVADSKSFTDKSKRIAYYTTGELSQFLSTELANECPELTPGVS